MTTLPFAYQQEGLERICQFEKMLNCPGSRALVAWEPGLGKTLLSLLYLHRHPEIKRAVVVCPASIKYVWKHEAALHINLPAQVLSSRSPPKRAGLELSSRLLIINYDILAWWLDWLREYNPQMVVLDETQMIKSRGAQRTKACRALCKNVPHVLGLSGTPLLNRPAELYPILHLLRADLYPNFSTYAHLHCAPRKTPWGWEYKGAKRLNYLHTNLLNTMMIRARKEDVLKDLPEKIDSIVPLPLKNRKEYDYAVKDFLGWLADKSPVLAANAARTERMTRLGYLKRLVAELKLQSDFEWLDNYLEEGEGKLIVFGIHRKILDAFENRYKDICVRVDGNVKGENRQLAFDRFNRDNKVRLFFGNMEAAGVGWSCTSTSSMAFVEYPWSPGLLTQCKERIRGVKRGLEGHHSQYYFLVAPDTIEEDLLHLLEKKQKILDKVLDGGFVSTDMDLFSMLTEKLGRRK